MPVPEEIANAMAFVSEVTVLPPASSIVMVGWIPKGLPATAPPGWIVKTSWAAAPTVTSNEPPVTWKSSMVSVALKV